MSEHCAKAPFVYHRQVHFGDADPARIVYTVRFLDYAMEAIDGWFRAVLGYDWYRLNVELGIGSPLVHLRLDFFAPLVPGDTVAVTVLVGDMGHSSLTFELLGHRNAREKCYTGTITVSFIKIETANSIPIPTEFRSRIEGYISACSTTDSNTQELNASPTQKS